MLDQVLDFLIYHMRICFVPLVCAYYTIAGNLFLNCASSDAKGLELLGDTLLIPFQYIFCGQLATPTQQSTWTYTQRFEYKEAFWIKMTASVAALPACTALGAAIKGLAYLSPECRKHMQARNAYYLSPNTVSHLEEYKSLGIEIAKPQIFNHQGYERRPGDEKHLAVEKEALQIIGSLLTKANIIWWVDCGSCLGAYRYGGCIPWDEDIDVAVLEPDFDNVRRALSQLDPQKYLLQDWSGRLNPYNYFKVYIKETGTLIDIYFFAVDFKEKTLRYILSLETCCLFPESWKIRERRFTVPTSFSTVFPLKKALFDGVEVFIPNDPMSYLQRYYGKNLDPVKIYNSQTGRYEKDWTHPYWQNQYVH